MLKPIVNMNTMAMNESIATTCCYVWNGTSVAGSASLPHGGKLVGSSSSKYYLKSNRAVEVSKGWINWKGGHIKTAEANKYHPFESAGTWYLNDGNGNYKLNSENFGDSKNIALDGWCDHVKGNCAYEKVTSFSGMTHTGATSAHYTWTSGNSWLSDHTAYQYSS